jgi:exodeoxyribonuclease X
VRIRVVDLETTGDAPPDHAVCEIGWCDVKSTRQDLIERPSGWEVGLPLAQLINPRRSIPPETAAIHHIIDEDVAGSPTWDQVASHVLDPAYALGEEPIGAFCAHSIKFERRFISDEAIRGLPWIDTYKCALRLWPDAPSHSNQTLRYWRKPIGLDRDLARLAHRAGPDAYVSAFHLRDLLDLAEVPDLIKWSNEPALQVTCHIGKQRGMKWRDVDVGFLYWLLDKDFDEDVLFTARTEIERREHEHARPVEPEDEDQSAGAA